MLVRLGLLDVLPINRRQAIDSSGREVELRPMASRGFSQVASSGRQRRKDIHCAQLREELGKHVLGIDAVMKPGPPRLDGVADVVEFTVEDEVSCGAASKSRSRRCSISPPATTPTGVSTVGSIVTSSPSGAPGPEARSWRRGV